MFDGSRSRIIRQRRGRITRGIAGAAVAGVIARGVQSYDRRVHLPRLIPVGPDEIADGRIEARRRIAAKLARALRAERNRGRAGHWTYDLNRHLGLKQAYEAECRMIGPIPNAGR
jgi:hypothetical protein